LDWSVKVNGAKQSASFYYSSDPAQIKTVFPPCYYYRGWSYAGYNPNYKSDNFENPINVKQLDVDTKNSNSSNQPNYMYMTSCLNTCWDGPSPGSGCKTTMASGRVGANIPQFSNTAFSGSAGVIELGQSWETGEGLGISPFMSSATQGDASGSLSFFDLNGDMFPDVVMPPQVQFTTTVGTLGSTKTIHSAGSAVRTSDNTAQSFGLGGTVASSSVSSSGSSGTSGYRSNKPKTSSPHAQSDQMVSIGFALSGSLGSGNNTETSGFMDVNGDSLPDRCTQSDSGVSCYLNLGGQSFRSTAYVLNGAKLSKGSSFSTSIGGGFNDGIYGYGGGVNYATTSSSAQSSLVDMDRDGNLDIVTAESNGILTVQLNYGMGQFSSPMVWANAGGIASDSDDTVGW